VPWGNEVGNTDFDTADMESQRRCRRGRLLIDNKHDREDQAPVLGASEIFRVDVGGLRKHADFGSSVDGWGTNCGTSMLQPQPMDSYPRSARRLVWSKVLAGYLPEPRALRTDRSKLFGGRSLDLRKQANLRVLKRGLGKEVGKNGEPLFRYADPIRHRRNRLSSRPNGCLTRTSIARRASITPTTTFGLELQR
jgi:hypothetical protein